MILQRNKFNVINIIPNKEINYNSLIKNYLENYLESNINIYHPDYIYQLIWNNKISIDEVTQIFNDALNNIIIQKKQNIRFLIKKNKFNLSSLYHLINTLNLIILKLENILCLKNKNISDILKRILLEPILINYLESETENLDNETISNIRKITNLLCECSTENYNWFLKLIGSVLKNNTLSLNINIPLKYKYLYEFNNIIEYTNTIKKVYSFLNESIIILLNPLNEIILSKFIICINNCNIIELLNLINDKHLLINIFNENEKKLIINAISDNFNNYISHIHLFDYNKIKCLLKLINICKNLKILENYILLIIEDNKILNSILNIIHETINFDLVFVKSIIILLQIKNKDEFMDKYHKLLIQRLLSTETIIENEQIIINELLFVFGPKITNKSIRAINDYKKSMEELNIYYNKSNIKIFSTITTSYANWDINYNQGYVTFNDINNKLIDLESYITNYQIYYNVIYNNKKKLMWLLQHGEVEITYNNIEIKLLPIQLMVLELYNVKYKFTINEIYNQTFFINYSNKFKEDIVNSLIIGNILFENDNYLYLNENNTHNIACNLISVYLNDTISENKLSQINTQYELAHNREDIVKTLINHNLKLNSYDKDVLFTKLTDNVSIFKLTSEIYNNAINKMIKYDYITMENNVLTKCVY